MQTLNQLSQIFEQHLRENRLSQAPEALYEPVNYILSIGGKRMRPLLALLGCNVFADSVQKALPAALAVEVFHNFSLLHDDVMDNAPLRRGKPTVHEKYNLNTAILSGDVMLIKAYEYLMTLAIDDHLKVKCLHLFNKMAVEVCEGQQYDMNFETQTTVTIPEYLKMIEWKTAVLLACALQIGALVGGASEDDAFHLAEFGRNLGISFQIQDDILDTFGDPEKFGKKVGGDIVQNKKTYLVLRTLELANIEQQNNLRSLMNEPTSNEMAKIEAVKAIFEAVAVRSHAENLMNDYYQTALHHLNDLHIDGERKQYLVKFAENLMQREV